MGNGSDKNSEKMREILRKSQSTRNILKNRQKRYSRNGTLIVMNIDDYTNHNSNDDDDDDDDHGTGKGQVKLDRLS